MLRRHRSRVGLLGGALVLLGGAAFLALPGNSGAATVPAPTAPSTSR